MKEVVLPSGRFASVRPITVGAMSRAYDANTVLFLSRLAQELTLIDGKQVPLSEITNADYEEWTPVFELISQQLSRIGQLKGGIA